MRFLFSCPPNCEPGSLSRHNTHTVHIGFIVTQPGILFISTLSLHSIPHSFFLPATFLSHSFLLFPFFFLSSLIAHLLLLYAAHWSITPCLSPTCSLPSIYPFPSTLILPCFVIPLISLSVTHHVLHSLMYSF